MTLEHLNTTQTPSDPPPEEPNVPETPGKGEPPKKSRLGWIVAAALLVIAVAGAVIWFTRPVLPDPYEAADAALDSLRSLSDPAALGVLGQGELADGTRFGVSGNWNLQAGEEGLAMSLTDFTLADEDGSTDIEVYLDQTAAALRVPELTGEAWYGVDLTQALAAQAAEAAGSELLDWYFGAAELEEAQALLDELRAALSEVRTLGIAATEKEALKDILHNMDASVEKTEDGFLLTFTGAQKDASNDLKSSSNVLQDSLFLPENATFFLRLNAQKALTYVELSSRDLHISLDLTDPEEPAPRLELQWVEGGSEENSLELAFTISEGMPLEKPSYTNAFSLLSILASAK